MSAAHGNEGGDGIHSSVAVAQQSVRELEGGLQRHEAMGGCVMVHGNARQGSVTGSAPERLCQGSGEQDAAHMLHCWGLVPGCVCVGAGWYHDARTLPCPHWQTPTASGFSTFSPVRLTCPKMQIKCCTACLTAATKRCRQCYVAHCWASACVLASSQHHKHVGDALVAPLPMAPSGGWCVAHQGRGDVAQLPGPRTWDC